MATGEEQREHSLSERELRKDLYALPLDGFIAARNALASRLKKAGLIDEAARIKALVKPSISAWAVNQLYWKHQADFEELLAAGEKVRQAHTAQFSGKPAGVPAALAKRRAVVSHLTRYAEEILESAGHAATSDTLRRVAANLEALSTNELHVASTPLGQLGQDLPPPGFDTMAGLVPSPQPPKRRSPARLDAAKKRLDEIAATLERAKEVAEDSAANQRDAEKRLENARAASQDANRHVQDLTAELEEASRAVRDAERES